MPFWKTFERSDIYIVYTVGQNVFNLNINEQNLRTKKLSDLENCISTYFEALGELQLLAYSTFIAPRTADTPCITGCNSM